MRKHRSDAGFSLAALIFFVTAASVIIAAIVPSYQMQAKREQEEELLFRGGEYARAIQKYQRRFGVYPSSIDQLLSTNQLRFLRRKYADPITGKDFRLIILNPDGSLTGSKTFTQNINNQSLFGNTQTFGGNNNTQGNPNPSGNPNTGNPNSSSPISTNPFNNPNSPLNNSNSPLNNPNSPFSGGTNNSRPGTTTGTGFGSPFGGTNPATNQPGNAGTTNRPGTVGGIGSSTGNQSFGAGGIVGVASDSDKDSIKIVNNHQKYDEWEFLAVLNQLGANPNGTPNSAAGPNANNPGGFNPNGVNSQRPLGGAGNPLGPAGNPLGPAGNPLGTGTGTGPFGTNPFGTPQTTQPRK
jgi:type II secretory pathway pseudopilin PulG